MPLRFTVAQGHEYSWKNGTVFPSNGTVMHPRELGARAARVPLDPSLVPTCSQAGEWTDLQNLRRDRRPFCWNVRLIWQYFVDRRKANAWTWSLMMDFLLTCQLMSIKKNMPVQIENFVTWIAEERREFHETQWHDICIFISLWITHMRVARKAGTARRPR